MYHADGDEDEQDDTPLFDTVTAPLSGDAFIKRKKKEIPVRANRCAVRSRSQLALTVRLSLPVSHHTPHRTPHTVQSIRW